MGAEGSPARGSGAEALTGREPLISFHLSSLSGFCWDHFTDGLRFGQTPLTLNVTLPRTYSPELASPVEKVPTGPLQVPLGPPTQGVIGCGLHGLRYDPCFVCSERRVPRPAVAHLCLLVWPPGGFPSLTSAPYNPVLPYEELLELRRPWQSLCLHSASGF